MNYSAQVYLFQTVTSKSLMCENIVAPMRVWGCLLLTRNIIIASIDEATRKYKHFQDSN